MTAPEETGTGPVIRDHRRIDPVTGQPKRGKHAASQPAGTSGASPPGGAGAGSARHGKAGDGKADEAGETELTETEAAELLAAKELRTKLAERTADLQRLQAEYANYRKRVDRDRASVREYAVAGALTELLPALDAISQAREHGELSGGFKSVADSLQAALGKLGLVSYGQRGDLFDPKIHEALTHSYSPDVTEDTCVEIFQPGYKVGERILRPARVAVAEPATGPDGSANAAAEWETGEETD
jgi:molecular chaperone GrpE